MRTPIILILLLFPFIIYSQDTAVLNSKQRSAESGQFSLGMRNTMSMFGSSGYTGLGYGGQFRIRLGRKLNTEWYADWITTDIGGLGKREDAHIGWSVMFYPLERAPQKGKLSPYLLAGHCFDYTQVRTNRTVFLPDSKHRLSTAVQMGLGTNYLIGDRTDISLSAQYMSHLGNDIETIKKTSETTGVNYLVIDDSDDGLTLEGHLLVTLSVNVMITDFRK